MDPDRSSPLREAARALGRASVSGNHAEVHAILAEQPRHDAESFYRALAADEPWMAAEITSGQAFAANGSWWREAAWLREHFDAEDAKHRRRREAAADPRRRTISGAAFAALRDRVPPGDMLARLYRRNAALSDPLPVSEVDRIALWCAKQAREASHA